MSLKKLIGSIVSFLLIIQISILGFLLPVNGVYAATQDITKLVFITGEQTIKVDEKSKIITVQTQNKNGAKEKLNTSNGVVKFYSDSDTGLFAEGPYCNNWKQIVSFSMNSGTANKNVCYKNSVAGQYNIFAEMEKYPLDAIEPWEKAKQTITVLADNINSVINVVNYSKFLRTNDTFVVISDIIDKNGIKNITTNFVKKGDKDILGDLSSNFTPGDITQYLYVGSYTIPDSASWPEGIYEAIISVTDKLGNKVALPLEFIVDNTIPELSMQIEQIPNQKKANIFFEAQDNLSGVAEISLFIYSENNEKLLYLKNFAYEEFKDDYLIEVDFEDYGTYEIILIALDNAGNETKEITKTITISQPIPVVIEGLEKHEGENSVLFTWTQLPDEGLSVVIYRSDKEESIAKIDNANFFEDKNLEPGKLYIYSFYVKDAQGNKFNPHIIEVFLKITQVPQAPAENQNQQPQQAIHRDIIVAPAVTSPVVDSIEKNEVEKETERDVLGKEDEKRISGGATEAQKESPRLTTLLLLLMLGMAVYFSSSENRKKILGKLKTAILFLVSKLKKENKKRKTKK